MEHLGYDFQNLFSTLKTPHRQFPVHCGSDDVTRAEIQAALRFMIARRFFADLIQLQTVYRPPPPGKLRFSPLKNNAEKKFAFTYGPFLRGHGVVPSLLKTHKSTHRGFSVFFLGQKKHSKDRARRVQITIYFLTCKSRKRSP